MKYISCLCIVFCIVACNPYPYIDLAPAYIDVDQVELTTANGQKLMHNIKDLWLFVDDGYAGTFSVPAHIPVLEPGKHKVSFYPGIRNYGILSKPEIYTLLNEFVTHADFIPPATVKIIPTFSYKSNSIIYLQDGFESSSVFVNDLDSFKNSTIVRSGLRVSEGKYSGYGSLDVNNPVIEASTNTFMISTSAKKSAYLELDCLSDTEIQIGLLPVLPGAARIYFLTLNLVPDWKKIYIPLYEIFQTNDDLVSAGAIQILIKSSLIAPATQAYFFIDNIKVISLP